MSSKSGPNVLNLFKTGLYQKQKMYGRYYSTQPPNDNNLITSKRFVTSNRFTLSVYSRVPLPRGLIRSNIKISYKDTQYCYKKYLKYVVFEIYKLYTAHKKFMNGLACRGFGPYGAINSTGLCQKNFVYKSPK